MCVCVCVRLCVCCPLRDVEWDFSLRQRVECCACSRCEGVELFVGVCLHTCVFVNVNVSSPQRVDCVHTYYHGNFIRCC